MTNRPLSPIPAHLVMGLVVAFALAGGGACGDDEPDTNDAGTGGPDTGTGGPADTGSGGTDAGPTDSGSSAVCADVATRPGTWDITLQLGSGGTVELTELGVTQIACNLIMFANTPGQSLGLTGPLSETGEWTAAVVRTDTEGSVSFEATFVGSFSGGPPYTALTIDSGSVTSGDGDTITGGSGAISE